jgi:hypothetical protein
MNPAGPPESCKFAVFIVDTGAQLKDLDPVDLPQSVAWGGCMNEEVCCLAHVEITDHHQVQLELQR